jgi:RNA polymerase sigma-70 factor (ECF subfamily)
MSDSTLTDLERLGAFEEAERSFQMTEEAFRIFYEQTARPLWLYLARMTGNDRHADDLLQESYCRFLRSRATFQSDEHSRHYLFRIATNLVRDHWRRPLPETAPLEAGERHASTGVDRDAATRIVRRIDLSRAMQQLTARDRGLLWLAYAQGWSHEELAAAHGLKAASLKALLFRARRRLATLLAGARSEGGRR